MSALDVALIEALRGAQVHQPAGELGASLRSSIETVTARISELRAAGFEIEERPELGYRLLASPDRLIADDLRARLGPSDFIREIIVFEETDSTNERAAQLGRSGTPGGLAIFAEHQTAGRGRFGRRWESASHRGLWFSLLLRPPFPLPLSLRLTTWAGVAVARALEQVAPVQARIKWPNDVYLNDRKVAGILIETGLDPAGTHFAIVGIGVNVNHVREDFPGSLRDHATSLRLVVGRKADRPAFAAALLRELEASFAQLDNEFDQLIAEATRRSALLGRSVVVRAGDVTIEGFAEGLDTDGRLLIRSPSGEVHRLSGGEVTLVGRYRCEADIRLD